MSPTEVLQETDLFGDLDAPDCEQLAEASTLRSLRRNDVLFQEDDYAHHLFIVTSGRIAIVNRSFDGRESVVALMEPGDLFGEMGLFDNGGRSAEARALETSEVLEVPFEPVLALYDARPSYMKSVISLLSRRLRAMDQVLADSVFLDVTGRTAKRLLELSGGEEVFTLPVTQEELAGMVGASRERVNKSIAQFIKLGWLAHEDDGYRITDLEQLRIRAM